MPVVVGMSNLREVRRGRRCMGVGQGRGRQEELERSPAGWYGVPWATGCDSQFTKTIIFAFACV